MNPTLQNLVNQGLNIGLKVLGCDNPLGHRRVAYWLCHASTDEEFGEAEGRDDTHPLHRLRRDSPAEGRLDRLYPWLLWHSDDYVCGSDSGYRHRHRRSLGRFVGEPRG